jgi:hypothetical protein
MYLSNYMTKIIVLGVIEHWNCRKVRVLSFNALLLIIALLVEFLASVLEILIVPINSIP